MLYLLIEPPALYGQIQLENYIKEGLESNLTLKQKNISLEQATYSLKTANSLFLPSLNLNGGYTHGNGGRSIALPVGDLLNPVYSTLNELISADAFPQIQNVEQTFFPRNFYDVHVRTSVPVINPELQANKVVQQNQVILKNYEVKIYKRELIKNIKIAYYNYLNALEAKRIYESALELVQQNINVNKSLLQNGKGLPASVLRAQSEYENIQAQLNDAENKVNNAQFYFNFLLNKDRNSTIEVTENIDPELDYVEQLIALPERQHREELDLLKTGNNINKSILKLNKGYIIPKVNAFIDVGAQAENLEVNRNAGYYLLGLSLDFPIFNGFRNTHKIKQAELDVQSSDLQLESLKNQLDMAAEIAVNDLDAAYQNYTSAHRQLQAAESYFKLIDKGYKEGTNSMIEFIDGRSQMTTAQLLVKINTYKVLSALAEYERANASYPLQ